MIYKGFRSLKKSKPPIKLQHKITGIGALEREGWTSVGKLLYYLSAVVFIFMMFN